MYTVQNIEKWQRELKDISAALAPWNGTQSSPN